ncbi:hypothetical protein ABPG75_010302 [Micractinium tetrahymenae]
MPQLAGFLAADRLAVLPGAQVVPGQQLSLQKSEDNGAAVLANAAGKDCLTEAAAAAGGVPPPTARQPTPLSDALSVVKGYGAQCYAQVAAVDGGTASVRLAVVLPDALWRPYPTWKGGAQAGSLFARLAPPALERQPEGDQGQPAWGKVLAADGNSSCASQQPQPTPGQPQPGRQQQQQQQLPSYLERLQASLSGLRELDSSMDASSLPACFHALPVKATQPDPPPLRAADPSRPSLLAQLDAAPLQLSLSKLDPASLRAAAASCRHFRELSRDVAPGLKLTLFPHQRAAVMWMQGREAKGPPQPHPTIAAFHCAEVAPGAAACFGGGPLQPGLPLWVDTATGSCWTEEPPHWRLPDFQGGLFCDEPGLGKTVTGIALLLRSLGVLPAAPPGAEVVWVQPGQKGYYLLPREEAATASRLMRKSSGGSRLSLRRTRSSGAAAAAGEGADGAAGEAPAVKRRRRGSGSGSASALGQQDEEQQAGVNDEGMDPGTVDAAAAAEGAAMEEAAAEPKVPGAPDWLPCDLCGTWRRLPPGCEAPAGVFVCSKNPDDALQWQGCQAPQEPFEDANGRVAFFPGWVPAGTAQGAPHNLAHYRRLLARFPAHFPARTGDRCSPVCWLAAQLVQKVMAGTIEIQPPGRRKHYPGFSQLFLEMGLEPALQAEQPSQQQAGRSRRSSAASGGTSGARGSGPRQQSGSVARRQQPAHRGRRLSYASEDDENEDVEVSFSIDWGSSSSGGAEGEEEDGSSEAGQTSGDEGSSAQVAVGTARQQGQRRRGRARPASLDKWASWRRPDSHAGLALDLEALRQALAEGPWQPPHKVFLSPATLVVVPPTLIDHWRTQIRLHVERQVPGGPAAGGSGGGGEEWVEGRSGIRVIEYTTESKEAARRAGRPLTAQRLAWEADVVLTTMDTMSAEWQAGNPIGCSPLMQVRWLRIVVDEGHKLGSAGGMTNKLQMASLLHAERRWVMTGTPTPNTDSASVDSLRPLLAFLHQAPYGADETAWKDAVKAPFERRQEEGRLRLLALLQRCMIRASKAELINLGIPPLHSKVVLLDFAPSHATSYNSFVDILRLNMLSSDWYDPDHQESLLNSRRRENREYAARTLTNIRMSANVAGNCKLQVLASDVVETMQLLTLRELSRQQGTPAEAIPLAHRAQQAGDLAPLAELLASAGADWQRRAAHIRACLEEGGPCERCNAVVRVLLAAPCACLLCVDCASTDRERCACCATPYGMQAVDDPARKADNPSPKWPVPLELIEWQPAFAQRGAKGITEGFWQPEWQLTQSTKCVYLLRRLLEVGAAVPPGGSTSSSRHPSCKTIVYTQFWHHLQLVESYLKAHGVPVAVLSSAVMRRKDDMRAQLNKFKHFPACGVLLMDSSGSVGLDLSFASYVFLMEPIPDRAVLEQVVGRAHRMGAKRAVYVEVLAMRGTVEESMVQRAAGAASAAGIAGTAGITGAAGAAPAGPDAQQQQQQQQEGPRQPAAQPAAGAAGSSRARQQSAEEKRTAERKVLLLALRPVPVSDLAEFEDLPGAAPGQGPGLEGHRRHQQQAPEEQRRRQEQRQQQHAQPGAAPEQPGMQPRQGAAAAASASYGSGSSEEEEQQEQQVQAPAPAPAGRETERPSRSLTWPEVAAQPGRPKRSATLPPGAQPAPATGSEAAASGGAGTAEVQAPAAAAAAAAAQRRRPAQQRGVQLGGGEPMQDDTADEGRAQQNRLLTDRDAGVAAAKTAAAAATAAVVAAAGEAAPGPVDQPPAGVPTPTAEAVQGGSETTISDTASTAAAVGAEASSAAASAAAEPPAGKRRRTVQFADEAQGPAPAPRLRDRLLRRVLSGQVHAAGWAQQQAQQAQQPVPVAGHAEQPVAAVAAPPAAAVWGAPGAAPAAAAAGAPAAQPPGQGAVAAAGSSVCRLLLEQCQLEAAQAAGLDVPLVGAFTGAFAGMDARQQQHHSELLPLMLGSGLHAAAAAHIRACLHRLGLLPS